MMRRTFILLIVLLLYELPIFSGNFTIYPISQSNQNFIAVQPLGIAASNNYIYVTTADGLLTLTTNLSIVNFTQLPGAAIPLAINNTVYVTDSDCNNLFAIVNGKVIENISLGANTNDVGQILPREIYGYGLTYDPNNNMIYVANGVLGYVTAVDLASHSVKRITGFSEPTDVIYDPNNGLVYVTDLNSFDISAIQGTSVVNKITINLPTTMGIIENNVLYITSSLFAFLVIINVTSGAHTCINTGNEPFFVTYDPQNGNVYVTEFGSNSILVVHDNKVVGQYKVGSQPAGILYYNGLLYVALYGENKIVALNPNTMSVVYSLTLTHTYTDIISYNGNLYITEYYDNKVLEMSSNGSVIGNITLASNPYSITVGGKVIYVTCPNSNTVIELSPQLKILGTIKIPNPTWITYYNNELYITSYNNNLLYVINPTSGKNESISTGLGPSYVMVYNGVIYVLDQLSDQITVINGNQESDVNLFFTPLGIVISKSFIYVIGNDQIDIFNKNFQDVNNVYINLVSYPLSIPQFYQGIIYGNCVYLPYDNYVGVFNGSMEITSYKLPNLVTALTQADGNIYVTSPFSTLYIFLKPPTYFVKIVESGLPNGMTWSVKINRTVEESSSPMILLDLTEGIYNISVMNISHYYSNFTYRIINVTSNRTIYIKFYPVYYSLEFKAVNLNTSISWQIKINGTLYNVSNNINFTVRLPYGVYFYHIIPPNGYNTTDLFGIIYLDHNEIINITFAKIRVSKLNTTTTTSTSSTTNTFTTTSTSNTSTSSSSTTSTTSSSTTSKLITKPPPPVLISSSTQASNNFNKYIGVILIIIIASILGIIILLRK